LSTNVGAASAGLSAFLLDHLANNEAVVPENFLGGSVPEGQLTIANWFQLFGETIDLLDQIYETGETTGTGPNNSSSQGNCTSFGNDFGDSFSSFPNVL